MKKGFTLIEAIVTIVIFAIGVLSIGLLYSVITESNVKSEQKIRSAIMLEYMLDDLQTFSQRTYVDTITGKVVALGFDTLWAHAKKDAHYDTFMTRSDTLSGVTYTVYAIERNTVGLTPWDPGARIEVAIICQWVSGEDILMDSIRTCISRHN